MKSISHKIGVLGMLIMIPFFCEFAFQPKDSWVWPTEPKNLKVLPKGTGGDQLKEIMQGWNKALGVKCFFCHKNKEGAPFSEWDFPSDEKPEKNMTRAMVKMTMDINKKWITKKFKSEHMITCATCHRGEKAPSM
ncbi:MAG: c-type cytochrome [Saprospiraceae bacterium]